MGTPQARSDKSFTFWTEGCAFRRRFLVLKRNIERLHDVRLPSPRLRGNDSEKLSQLRRFCSAPLERESHGWDIALSDRKLGKRTRFSIWMSLFLFRKVLPPKEPDLRSFLNRVTSEPSPEPCPIFMEFVRSEMGKMFRPGWDRSYPDLVGVSTLSTSSCVQTPKGSGGTRMYWLDKYKEETRKEFCDALLHSQDPPRGLPPSRITSVFTGGKYRVLTVPPAQFALLKPLHSAMYNHLSKNDWLLRGDASARSFKGFARVPGEVFVSGDFESATDNLNQNVQKEILRILLQNTVNVPNGIRRLAMSSLSSSVSLREESGGKMTLVGEGPIVHGQMMGFLLSFPLLCIVNYLSFRYATMDKNIPVRINGDDIVFRARPEVAKRWMEGVGKSGLKLSVGKTLVDRSVFTLNSTLFSASVSVKRVPIIRSTAFFGVGDGSPLTSLVGRFRSAFPGFDQTRGFKLKVAFLRENVGWICSSRRSLNRGLGIPVPPAILLAARLWKREIDYLSLPAERPPPAPFAIWQQKPVGYELVHQQDPPSKKFDKELVEAVVESAWLPPSVERYEDEEWRGCLTFGKPPSRTKLFGITRQEYDEQISQREKEIWFSFLGRRVRLYPVWKKVGRPIDFKSDSASFVVPSGSLPDSVALQESFENDEAYPQPIPPPEGLCLPSGCGVALCGLCGQRGHSRSFCRRKLVPVPSTS